MLIQDLKFFEQIENPDDIKGGTAAKASKVKKPSSKANALAAGDYNYVRTTSTGPDGVPTDGVSTSVLAPDILGLDLSDLELKAVLLELKL